LSKGAYSADLLLEMPVQLQNAERDLIKEIAKFPEILVAAARDYSPSTIANYCYELAKLYNKFYHEVSILKAEEEMVKYFRLHLSAVTAKVIARGMALLGIAVPERM